MAMRISLQKLLVAVNCAFLIASGGLIAAQAQFDGTAPSGPIDIHADEQEFAENSVIAKGNVRVLYKDSVITGPIAYLTRDPLGNPQKAVFTGHPHLTQGTNTIDATVLTFDIAGSKVIAEGSAHSEVVSQNNNDTANGAAAKPAGGNKIITDSDRQEYDRAGGRFEATGHVRVNHGDIKVNSDRLQLVYGTDNKPETAVFTGHVNATQGKNTTSADTMTYFLSTQRLQATGNVKSKVIQEKKDAKGNTKSMSFFDTGLIPAAHAASKPAPQANLSGSGTATASSEEETIIITSDAQDYAKESGKMTATGNVKVYYQDTIGAGPKVLLFRNLEGKAERVLFIGRSQISQPGRRWIADSITFTTADRKVLAQGNTKAYILQTPKTPGAPTPVIPSTNNSRVADSERVRAQ
jgi:lipopolysaccharide export system protein LptA